MRLAACARVCANRGPPRMYTPIKRARGELPAPARVEIGVRRQVATLQAATLTFFASGSPSTGTLYGAFAAAAGTGTVISSTPFLNVAFTSL
jgi:hypothetical protein